MSASTSSSSLTADQIIEDLTRRGQSERQRAENAENQVAALNSQIHSERAQHRAAAPRASIARPRMPQSSIFDGSIGLRVDEWLKEMVRQFTFYPDHFTGVDAEQMKVSHSIGFVNGKAAAWFDAHQAAHPRVDDAKRIQTFAQLEEQMRARFQPISSSMAARSALDRGSQSASVSSYNTFFYSNLNFIPDMSLADQIHRYTSGLKENIRMEVLKENPPTLTEAVNYAVKVEAYLTLNGKSSSSYPHRSSGRYNYHSNGAAAASSSSSAMDVSNINFIAESDDDFERVDRPSAREQQLEAQVKEMQQQHKFYSSLNAMFSSSSQPRQHGGSSSNHRDRNRNDNRVPNITKEMFTRCRTENRCLRCKEVGHVAYGCEKAFVINL